MGNQGTGVCGQAKPQSSYPKSSPLVRFGEPWRFRVSLLI